MKIGLLIASVICLSSCAQTLLVSAGGGKLASNASLDTSKSVSPSLFAKQVSVAELNDIICATVDTKFGNRWLYMGSNADHDFISTARFLKSRDIYKLPKQALYLAPSFELTSNKTLWQPIVIYTPAKRESSASHWQLSRCVGGKILYPVFDNPKSTTGV
ncbi:hypothetical protein C2869_03485 [Saccharobesus litoralis]|uniref:Uncharacterized protein n=1 Tax=Saccharobesus litoralis TaxID=2172099 RepID=A0A2S0VMW0_9ALTE|nr:hypothetical protein [Saccharobesus litoralis]AWB65554.1 hypothetical protein C2869_03485 [Saccharobesus litoralis]